MHHNYKKDLNNLINQNIVFDNRYLVDPNDLFYQDHHSSLW